MKHGKRVIALLLAVGLGFALPGCRGGVPAMGRCPDFICGGMKVTHYPGAPERAAAEKGDAEAQYELARRYAGGNGVSKDDAEALRWYQKSGDQGFGRAQLALAFIYGTGQGVAHDDVQALMWSTLAASAQGTTGTTKEDAANYSEFLQKRMTPEQVAEARKRASEWKPSKMASG